MAGRLPYYNTERLQSALGYVTPHDVLAGRRDAIHAERDRKFEAVRERRRQSRQAESIRVAPLPVETHATLVSELIPNPPVLSLTAEG
ncbi:MAG: hypothetical protein U0798_19400 [Gemmataceae bacterium]